MSDLKLEKLDSHKGPEGPVVLVIMDGVGMGHGDEGDMVSRASTPALDWLKEHAPTSTLRAHGSAVGMPTEGDMGNSEVGHNAIGAGRVFDQGASLVNKSIESGRIFEGDVWTSFTSHVKEADTTLHFLGLLSDGNVHTHINHLFAMLRKAAEGGVQKVRVHVLLDGRDVGPTSALEYVDQLEDVLSELNKTEGMDYAIASGGGRLKITMDRYEADWPMVERGWKIHVAGEGPKFASARDAIEQYRSEDPDVIDQDLPPFVIVRDAQPVGPVRDGDRFILFNFRGDRAMEISRAFQEKEFDKFERDPMPDIEFAGMMEYDPELGIPAKYLVTPPSIDRTLGAYLAANGVRQLAVSETQKFGHVTYFFNGNRSGKFNPDLEDYVEVPSDNLPFEQRPWMKAGEITDIVLDSIRQKRHPFIRLNYPNGDMVGHTGNLLAVEISVEAVDLSLTRLMKAIKKVNGILVVTADHGNADEMFERDKKTGALKRDAETGKLKSKTSHTLNPVPVHIYDPGNQAGVSLAKEENLGISSLAATCLKLLGYVPPEEYTPSIVDVGAF